MTDKILYTGGPNPFKGLIGGLPEKPRSCPGRGFCSCDGPPSKRCEVLAWEEQVESIKSNAPDIVSKIEHVATKRDGSGTIMISIEGHPIECKPGDIFPVPVGYEFKKGYQYHSSKKFYRDADWVDCDESQYESLLRIECMVRTVLRIVKTEVKEMPKIRVTTLTEAKEKIAAATVYKRWQNIEQELKGTEDYAGFLEMAALELEIALSQPETEESQKEFLEKIEFIKGAFQCFVGFSDHSGLKKFLEESKFTIQRKK